MLAEILDIGMDSESISIIDKDKEFIYIQECMDKIYDLYLRSLLPNDISVRDNQKMNQLLTEIEQTLSTRIGIQFRFYGTNRGAHCLVTPTPESNIINPYGRDTFLNLKMLLEQYKMTPVNKVSEVKYQNDTEKIYGTIHKSMIAIEEALIGKNVTVDYKNMRITGLSKDVVTFIGIPFRSYFKFGLSSREVTGILFHEVGHAFNMIATMHQMATSVASTADAIVNNQPNEKEIIKLAENVYNRRFKDGKELFYELFNGDIMYKDNGYSLKNNEAGADQLATRLGYGKDLVTALSKHYKLDFEDDKDEDDFITVYFKLVRFSLLVYFGSFLLLILSGFVLSLVLVVMPIFVILAVIKGMMMILESVSKLELFKNPQKLDIKDLTIEEHDYIGSYKKDSPYDDLKQRFKRIKMDIIRQLRIYDIDKRTVDKYLEDINTIDKITINIEQDRNIFTLIKHTLFMESNDVGTAKFFMNIEEMTENDFHVRNIEFKKLLQRRI